MTSGVAWQLRGVETWSMPSYKESMQRYHVDNVNAANSAYTRQRRIDKAVALLLTAPPHSEHH